MNIKQNYWLNLINMKIKEALAIANNILQDFAAAHIEAAALLSYVLKKNQAYLYAYPEHKLSAVHVKKFNKLCLLRKQKMPLAYLTGIKEFWSLTLQVNRHTLIPRPETELLVELAINAQANNFNVHVLDLGTGCGAIAVACAVERPYWHITATDCSLSALQIAKKNVAQLKLSNVYFYHSNWFAAIIHPQLFDIIISNPPYIAVNDPHLKIGGLPYEPECALISDEHGLAALKHIIIHARNRLKSKGLLLLEHGCTQASSVAAMLQSCGYTDIRCWQDYSGKYRVSSGSNNCLN